MKRLLSTITAIIACLSLQAQYDIIPLPQSIKIDSKGRMLDMTADTPVNDQLNPKITSPEGWRMTVDKQGITIEGSTEAVTV